MQTCAFQMCIVQGQPYLTTCHSGDMHWLKFRLEATGISEKLTDLHCFPMAVGRRRVCDHHNVKFCAGCLKDANVEFCHWQYERNPGGPLLSQPSRPDVSRTWQRDLPLVPPVSRTHRTRHGRGVWIPRKLWIRSSLQWLKSSSSWSQSHWKDNGGLSRLHLVHTFRVFKPLPCDIYSTAPPAL